MKYFLLFCFLILFWKPCQAYEKRSFKCREAIATYQEESYDTLPIKDFIQILIDLEIYSTVDFIELKTEGLPAGIPNKPLWAYPNLQGDWSNLWNKVNKIRVYKERKEQILSFIAENRQISAMKMAHKIGVSQSIVQRIIQKLIEEGQLVRIGFKNGGYWEILKEGAEPSPDPLEQRKKQILALIAENKKITMLEVASSIGLSKQATNRIADKLRKEGQLARIGSSQNGHWEILKEGAEPSPDPLEQRKEQILALIAEDQKITIKKLADIIKISTRAMKHIIKWLKEEERLVRIGHTNNGYWKIPAESLAN